MAQVKRDIVLLENHVEEARKAQLCAEDKLNWDAWRQDYLQDQLNSAKQRSLDLTEQASTFVRPEHQYRQRSRPSSVRSQLYNFDKNVKTDY